MYAEEIYFGCAEDLVSYSKLDWYGGDECYELAGGGCTYSYMPVFPPAWT